MADDLNVDDFKLEEDYEAKKQQMEDEKDRAYEQQLYKMVRDRIMDSPVTADTFFRVNNKCMLFTHLSCNNGDCRHCYYVPMKSISRSLMLVYEELMER